MKLYYNILWFEDQPNEIKNYLEGIERILANNGFKFKYEIKDKISQADLENLEQDLRQYNPYDLIIFDHDLGKGIEGASIAKKLRYSVYTDMIYYSGNTSIKLRDKLHEEEIDGVFIINRNDFINSISRILEDHISKLSDMNNMRGVFLDAFSKIEQYAREKMCSEVSQISDAQRPEIISKTVTYHEDKIAKRTQVKENLNADNISEHFYDTEHLEFDFIRRRLSKLDDSIWKQDAAVHRMQQLRNILAHRSYRYDTETNEVVIVTAKGEERFNIERFRDIRKTLLEILTQLGVE